MKNNNEKKNSTRLHQFDTVLLSTQWVRHRTPTQMFDVSEARHQHHRLQGVILTIIVKRDMVSTLF